MSCQTYGFVDTCETKELGRENDEDPMYPAWGGGARLPKVRDKDGNDGHGQRQTPATSFPLGKSKTPALHSPVRPYPFDAIDSVDAIDAIEKGKCEQ